MAREKISSEKIVLVIEDEPCLRMLVAEVLKELNLNVVALPSADVGYMLLQKHSAHIDLLVSDIRMPGKMSGVDLANRVSLEWPHIGVVLTSGYEAQAMAGLVKPPIFLPKPWTISMLQEAVVCAFE
ncbi:response regulator (plasmid) [Pseudomonas luteola]|uniref:response regulator n=1 Tax=Pseudomonas luteola TaxID=47886 RepID=UPI003DA03DAC